MTIEIERVPITVVEPLRCEAMLEGITFADRTKYYAAYKDGKLIGFCGAIWFKKSVEFKNAFVVPECRGIGVFRMMFLHRVRICKALGIKIINAFCTPAGAKQYRKLGAVQRGNPTKNGLIRMRIQL